MRAIRSCLYPITPKFRLLPVTLQSYKTLSLACVRLIAVVIFKSLNDAKCVNQLINQHNNSLRGSVYSLYSERTNSALVIKILTCSTFADIGGLCVTKRLLETRQSSGKTFTDNLVQCVETCTELYS